MPWYRIYANHGPGHQSSSEVYRWVEKPLSNEQRGEVWDNEMGTLDDPIGKVVEVKSIPEHIFEHKVSAAENAIRFNQRLLEVLKDTPTQPVIAVHFEAKGVHVARLLMKPEVSAQGATRDKAVAALMTILKKWWKSTPVNKNTFAVIVR